MSAGGPVLVTGFGPFPGVPTNPTDALVREVDGAVVSGVPVVGRVLPTSFVRGPDGAIAAARELGARLVVGLGVAVSRTAVCVERVGVWVGEGRADVDGSVATCLEGPETVLASLDVHRLASALGAELSDDAGRYVCNAWLYRVTRSLDVPVGFVHIPPSGITGARLLDGIRALL